MFFNLNKDIFAKKSLMDVKFLKSLILKNKQKVG